MRINILLSTVIFPNRFEINRGIYIKKQALELARRDRLTIVVPVPYLPSFLGSTPLGFYAKIPREDNIDGLQVHYPRFFIVPKVLRFLHGPFLFFSVCRFYYRVIRDEKPEILLGFWAFPDGFANVLVAKIFKLPVVIGCLGSDINQCTKTYLRRKMIGWTLRNCDQVLSVSEALKAEMVNRLNVSPQRVTVIPNGIEEEIFYPRDRNEMREVLGLEKQCQIAVCVARLEPVKGIDILVHAFARIRRDGRLLVIIGDGEEMSRMKSLVEELGLSRSVLLLGSKPHDEIPDWINAADLLILPSRTEGWPNTLMEAFSCGKPVVASRIGGVPEIINSPMLGIMTNPGDAEDLARGIEEGLARDWDAEVIRARVLGRSWAVVTDELRTELQQVLQRCRTPS
ncbi:MAG TPA: glycosyltransferase family 4 protein [Gammaproteobacteria bacterium]|nr:glycosyltransferase family 4 protein [Gammaproteobacteria bacterium]